MRSRTFIANRFVLFLELVLTERTFSYTKQNYGTSVHQIGSHSRAATTCVFVFVFRKNRKTK